MSANTGCGGSRENRKGAMTVTSPIYELLAHARRCECEQRFAQAAASYQQALDNMPNPHSLDVAGDRALIQGLMRTCIQRSQETVSIVATSATEEAKAAVDLQGQRMAEKRARAIAGINNVRIFP
jgi:hypothetical protein